MGVEARDDLRDGAEVAVDELAQPAVVVNGAGARATADEELEARDAERVLDVDRQQAEAEGVAGRRPDLMARSPRRRLARAVLVRDPPDLAHAARVEERRDREHLSRPADGHVIEHGP